MIVTALASAGAFFIMQIYMKHPEQGNAHCDESEQAQREAQGWVRWPRTAAQKAGMVEPAASSAPVPSKEPVKRKPGRPRKVEQ